MLNNKIDSLKQWNFSASIQTN